MWLIITSARDEGKQNMVQANQKMVKQTRTQTALFRVNKARNVTGREFT